MVKKKDSRRRSNSGCFQRRCVGWFMHFTEQFLRGFRWKRWQNGYWNSAPGGITAACSGRRPVVDTERAATDTYAPGAETEYDLMNAGAEQVFHLKRNYHEERYYNENKNLEWAIRRYDAEIGIPVVSISGPSSEPEKRRANSADTYRFFMEKYCMEPGRKLLLVTSQIYVPYQQIEAARIFSEMYVETVGFPTEWSAGLQGMMEPANYLQEIRSAIQAIHRYLEDQLHTRR